MWAPFGALSRAGGTLAASTRRERGTDVSMPRVRDDRIASRVFLVGCPRSGTTLLQCLLAAHPRIRSFPESHFFSRILGLAHDQIESALETFARSAQLYYSAQSAGGTRDAASYIDAFIHMLDQGAIDHGRDVWIEKTPTHLRHIELIDDHLESVKYIHILRSSYGTINSLSSLGRPSSEQWRGFRSIDACRKRWTNDVLISLRYVGHPRHHFVRYENLVARPARALRAACEFLDIDYIASMNGRHVEVARQLILPHERWKARVLGPVADSSRPRSPAYVPGTLADDIERRLASAQQQLDSTLPLW